jgi:hypothetical protein
MRCCCPCCIAAAITHSAPLLQLICHKPVLLVVKSLRLSLERLVIRHTEVEVMKPDWQQAPAWQVLVAGKMYLVRLGPSVVAAWDSFNAIICTVEILQLRHL